jgi:hypothetical protein
MIVPEFAKINQQFRKMKGNYTPREYSGRLKTERPCNWNSVNQELRFEQFFLKIFVL